MNRVEPPYDLRAGIVGSKASEAMIGFAGFVKNRPHEGDVLQGVLNISPFYREDGSGYLTLTFVVDRQVGVTLDESRRQLGVPDQADLEALLGGNFEMLMDIPLSDLSRPSPYLVEEMDIYFHQLRGIEINLIEKQVVPALSRLLGLQFEPFQRWQGTAAGQAED